MNIVITAPAGNIGSVVTRELLAAGEKPVLIARDPAKVQAAVDQGATVRQGSHADADFLIAATRDAEALFVLAPADYEIDDIRGYYRQFATAAAAAAKANNIPYVVHLSSVGAELPDGSGPVVGLNESERILDAAGIPNLVHLRPGYFMENTLVQIPNIATGGNLFTMFPVGTRFPMIATRDIGVRAAELLRQRDWSGHRIIELQGAAETSYDEVAEILAEVLERPVTHVPVTGPQLAEALTGMGLSQVMGDALVELSEGMITGHVQNREARNVQNTTPTSYADFAREVYRPAFLAALDS